jgi:hypothetical protein
LHPRRTDTAEIADLYLPAWHGCAAVQRLLHIIVAALPDSVTPAHQWFDARQSTQVDYTLTQQAETCGIAKEDLLTSA